MTSNGSVGRLRAVGFDVLPLLDRDGVDHALQFWRWDPNRLYLDVVAVFHDDYAVATRLPPQRAWESPFTPTAGGPVRPMPLEPLAAAFEQRFLWTPPGDHLR
ncbi:hypothetical protein UK23_11355 [Lentzea aerocolonigenes]|uniref:Uncharacterized protein n=1 Tax=Lentzea aerocolonigenes TaxID=68170 RepID=A0A0F0H9F3_LENAE|nr:hypothetical protein UK23_11355 [Lentzea aerocolonigenes]